MSMARVCGATCAATWQLAALAVATCCVTLAAPVLHNGPGGWTLVCAFVASSVGCWAAWNLAEVADQRIGLIIILASAVVMRIGFLFFEPMLSTDVYRYIWDGRVLAHGINPFRFIPAAAELQSLRDTAIWPNINRADYAVTIYPPVAQAFFWLVTRFGGSVVVMKLGLIACEAGTVLCLLGILARHGQSRLRIAAYLWHPLPIWEIAGNAHVDAAMIALLMSALLLFLRGQVLLAGVVVTLGSLVKPTALLALPVFWRPWNWRLPAVVMLTVVVAYLPFLSVGRGVLGFIPQYIEEEGLRTGQGYRLLLLMQHLMGGMAPSATVYLVLSAVILAAMALAAGFRADRSEAAAIGRLGWLLIAFLVLTSPHYPWYFLVLVPMLVLAPTWSGGMLSIAPITLYAGSGTDYEARNIALTLLALAALAADGWRYVDNIRNPRLGAPA